MDKSKVALGSTNAPLTATCLTINPTKLDPDERIQLLEEQMKHMQRIISKLKRTRSSSTEINGGVPSEDLNKDGIPLGMVCFGATEKSPFLFYLTVEMDYYTVGSYQFPSLSSAAEAVSGVRRSGWTFWKFLDGDKVKTLKETFKV